MIDVYCAVSAENVEEITQLTSCGILLIFQDSPHIRCRLMGYGLGASSLELANIQAMRLALASVNPAYRRSTVHIHVADESVLQLLASPEPSEAVSALLCWCEYYTDLGFIIESPNNENMMVCRSLARDICATQQTYDSRTLDHLPYER